MIASRALRVRASISCDRGIIGVSQRRVSVEVPVHHRPLVFLLVMALFTALMPASIHAQTEVTSKSLGLMEDDFPALYGAAGEDIMGAAYTVSGGKLIAYSSFGDPVSLVERTFSPGVSYEDAVVASQLLMPSDAIAVGQYVSVADIVVDVYTSEWLRAQFPDPDDWINSDPGTFIVEYGSYNPALGNDQVTRMLIGIGNNP